MKWKDMPKRQRKAFKIAIWMLVLVAVAGLLTSYIGMDMVYPINAWVLAFMVLIAVWLGIAWGIRMQAAHDVKNYLRDIPDERLKELTQRFTE